MSIRTKLIETEEGETARRNIDREINELKDEQKCACEKEEHDHDKRRKGKRQQRAMKERPREIEENI